MSRREDDEIERMFAPRHAAKAADDREARVAVRAPVIGRLALAAEAASVLMGQIERDYLKLSPSHKQRLATARRDLDEAMATLILTQRSLPDAPARTPPRPTSMPPKSMNPSSSTRKKSRRAGAA